MNEALVEHARELVEALRGLKFREPVSHVYNPLEYAARGHESYLTRFGGGRKQVLFLGMNPGPWGMAQTGVPFGEIPAVKNWMGIEEEIDKPETEHPKRPIEGFGCQRSEVSGRRLWGYFEEKFPEAEDFFRDHFVVNFCPLVWMAETGRNITPDKLPAEEMAPVLEACTSHLKQVVETLNPQTLIGVGAYAEERLKTVAGGRKVGRILHPSPASPAANRGWGLAAGKQMAALLADDFWLAGE